MVDEVDNNKVSADEITSSDSTALTLIDTDNLNQEAIKLINQIITEQDADKAKDLTYLFNINQNKKTMVRIDKLSGLQDSLVDQFTRRVAERPDEISNQELMNALKIVQDIIERGQKQISGATEKPLIQINTQTNNIGDEAAGLSRDSRKRVEDAVMNLLKGITAQTEQKPDAADVISQENYEIDQED